MASVMRRQRELALLIALTLAGCGSSEDRRLVSDEQSCRNMGHTPGAAVFQQCLNDLNQRRCGVIQGRKGGSQHAPTRECTRL